MSSRSERLEKRMAELSERFTAEIPTRLNRIETSVETYLGDRTYESLESVILHSHKLAGSAGSFGYHALAAAARELELFLVQVRNESSDLPQTSADANVRELVQKVREQASMAAPKHDENDKSATSNERSHEPASTKDEGSPAGNGFSQQRDSSGVTQFSPDEKGGSEAPRDTTVALLAGRSEHASGWEEIEAQLGYFGMRVERIATRAELHAVLDACRIVVVIAHVEALLEFAESGVDFSSLSDAGSAYAAVIAVSHDDSFETRLEAVRKGAMAFFSLPVDMPRIVDKIAEVEEEADPAPLHVLIVDDDVDQVSNIAYLLQREGMVTSVASDPTQVFDLMVEAKPEVVITDMYMPRCNGIELAKLIRQQESFVGIPIIFLSVESDIHQHMEAMSHGGDDFLVKPVNPDHLVSAVRVRARRQRQMRYFMERDSLTGMLNHSHLKQQLEREVQRAARISRPLCYCMIDLDNFKQVNDTYGHLTGDRVLKSISRLLHERLRKTDTIGRHGGEEFGIILFDTDSDRAAGIMDQLRESFSQIVHRAGETEFQLTFSCGIADYPRVSNVTRLTELADRALYQAKQTGKNRVVVV